MCPSLDLIGLAGHELFLLTNREGRGKLRNVRQSKKFSECSEFLVLPKHFLSVRDAT